MKKSFTLFIVLLFLFSAARATTVVITVTSNQFSPSNANVSVGDIISFHFSEGFHNATSVGDVIPNGAPNINSGAIATGVRTYNYIVSEPGSYHYYCEAHGSPSGGMAGMFTASGVVPVTLKLFEIITLADKNPLLSWKTLTEQNVAYFSVRSSIDGIHFSEIAKVPAKGNSNTEQVYSFKDDKLSPKYRYVYYELVTTDKNGKESYSAIKMFKTAFASRSLVVQLGPNPIKRPGQLMIQFNAENAGSMIVNVFDANGKRVLKTNMAAFPGLNNGHVHVCDLAPGVYTLQFNYEGLRETRRVVVN